MAIVVQMALVALGVVLVLLVIEVAEVLVAVLVIEVVVVVVVLVAFVVLIAIVIQGLCGPGCRDGPGGRCGRNGPREQRDPCGPSRQLGTSITQPQENKPMFIADCAHTIAAFIINLTNAFLRAFFIR